MKWVVRRSIARDHETALQILLEATSVRSNCREDDDIHMWVKDPESIAISNLSWIKA